MRIIESLKHWLKQIGLILKPTGLTEEQITILDRSAEKNRTRTKLEGTFIGDKLKCYNAVVSIFYAICCNVIITNVILVKIVIIFIFIR